MLSVTLFKSASGNINNTSCESDDNQLENDNFAKAVLEFGKIKIFHSIVFEFSSMALQQLWWHLLNVSRFSGRRIFLHIPHSTQQNKTEFQI